MPGKEDIVRLKHMLDGSQDAISFTQGKTRKSLDTDKMLVHSLVSPVGCAVRTFHKIIFKDYATPLP